MVVNPTKYQKLAQWSIESVLILIINALVEANNKLNQSDVRFILREEFNEVDVSGRQISDMIYHLKRRNYLEQRGGDSIALTNKARIKVIDKQSTETMPDGKYRLILFDIPESKKVNRNGFRRAIKKLGFIKVQKSLWVNNRNVGDIVEMLADEYKVSDYVAYFLSDKSNIDAHIANSIKQNQNRK